MTLKARLIKRTYKKGEHCEKADSKKKIYVDGDNRCNFTNKPDMLGVVLIGKSNICPH